MAQKAAKVLAVRNTTTLNRTHLISLVLNSVFVLLRFLFLDRSWLCYVLLSAPAFAIEFYLDRFGRPVHAQDGTLRRAGEDLEAKGLTEYMWDVLYWTWINVLLVVIFGDRAWWLYLVVPGYSAYLAATTVGGMKGMFGGAAGAQEDGQTQSTGGGSKRQAKMEKRGGQKVSYR